MRIIYPQHPLKNKEAEEQYQEEFVLLKSNGIDCSLFDFDSLAFNEFSPKPNLLKDEIVLYRGWMLNPENYQKLERFVKNKGATLFTQYEDYIACHHLPSWYESCLEFTAESVFLANDSALEKNIEALDWEAYFVKDYVKSNSTERGSIARSATEVTEIVDLISTYRGEIEGGVAIRRVEHYKDDSEERYFVFKGKAYSRNGKVPELVLEIASRISAPFFTIDMIEREDGELRLVEIGDGQVSDKKNWNVSVFAQIFLDHQH